MFYSPFSTHTFSQITFSKTGKPLTPLPDLRAPLLAKVYAKRVLILFLTPRSLWHLGLITITIGPAIVSGRVWVQLTSPNATTDI